LGTSGITEMENLNGIFAKSADEKERLMRLEKMAMPCPTKTRHVKASAFFRRCDTTSQ